MAVKVGNRVLLLVQNCSMPFDRRMWLIATALKDKGYTVTAISPRGAETDTEKFAKIDGIAIYRFWVPTSKGHKFGFLLEFFCSFWAMLIMCLRVWRKRGFDIIHAANPPDFLFIYGLFFKLFGKKFIFDHHDLSPESYITKFGRKDLLYYIQLTLENLSCKFAGAVISTNESYRQLVIKRHRLPENKVSVVRNGPSLSVLKKSPPNEKLKQGHQFMTGFIGEMAPQDGVDNALKALSIVIKNYRKDVFGVFIGFGSALNDMKNLAKDLGIADNVLFTGWIDDEMAGRYLCTTDVCLSPDPYDEFTDLSTMTKIMEFMFYRKPLVSYDMKEARYSAQEAALYAEPNNVEDFARQIDILLSDSDKRQKMGEFGEQRVLNHLAWERQVPYLLDVYRQCLTG